MNQELETYLRLFTSNKPEEWLTLLPMVEFTHNSATHSVTQKTPISLMMGYEPQAYPLLGKTFLPNLESQLSDLSTACNDTQATHKVAQQKMKEWISSKFTLESVTFGPGRDECRLSSSTEGFLRARRMDPGASRDVLVAYL